MKAVNRSVLWVTLCSVLAIITPTCGRAYFIFLPSKLVVG
jgi:hypothetical protein